MSARQRLAVCFSVTLVLVLGLGSAPMVALAQGFTPAGNYDRTGMLGSFFYNDSQTSVFVFANRQEVVGPSGTTDDTTLFLNVSAGFGALNVNCFIDDSSSDFNVTSDVQSASLHKTITSATPGCGGTVTSDLVVDITWTGAGPIQSTATTQRFMCSGYTDESHGTDSSNAGSATFNITGLAAPITPQDPQVFHFGSSLEHAQGAIPPDSCRGGIGRGAGRPTPAAGNYATTQQEASTTFFSSDFTTVLFLTVDRNTSTSSPLGGTPTSTDQTSISFFFSSFSNPTANAGGCFVINPGDFAFSRDVSTAALHTVLTGNTTACSSNNVIPTDPYPLDATWAGTAPVGTTMTNSQFACLTYHFQTSRVQMVNAVADTSVAMLGFSATLPGSGVIGSIGTRTHADGTPASGCFFRG